MSLVARRFEESDSDAWDELVAGSWNGTFLHTRRFLRYHGERFQDASLLLEDGARGNVLGVFPAAVDPRDSGCVTSHPGITYGGIVHRGGLLGMRMRAALEAICEHYDSAGFRALRYKVVPAIYHRRPAEDDRYALFLLGARRYRCDLSSTLDLATKPSLAPSKLRNIKKALRCGSSVETGAQFLRPFWDVLSANLDERHGASPVHSLEEIEDLHARFPENIICTVAVANGEVVAGSVTFRTDTVDHGQYYSASAEGRNLSALPLVVERCIAMAASSGRRYYDMGTSNEAEGRVLNEGLHRQKSEFGASGVVYEFYELPTGAQRL